MDTYVRKISSITLALTLLTFYGFQGLPILVEE